MVHADRRRRAVTYIFLQVLVEFGRRKGKRIRDSKLYSPMVFRCFVRLLSHLACLVSLTGRANGNHGKPTHHGGQPDRSLRQAGACIVQCENDFMYQCIVAAQPWTWFAEIISITSQSWCQFIQTGLDHIVRTMFCVCVGVFIECIVDEFLRTAGVPRPHQWPEEIMFAPYASTA